MRYLSILMIALVISACSKSEKTVSVGDLNKPGVVAVINGKEISVETFNKRYEWYVDRFKYRVPKKDFLKNLINLELSADEALKKKMNQEERLQYDYKVLLSQHLLEKEVYSQFKGLKISKKELKTFFKASPEIRASHILFKVDAKADEKKVAEIKKRALKVLARAKKGEKFETLAKKHSEGPSSKNGGDLDYFSRDRMVKEFSDVAFELKKIGDISGLVKTKYGFHIIKLTGRKKFKDADQRRLKSKLRSQKQKDLYESFFAKLREKANVQINEAAIAE